MNAFKTVLVALLLLFPALFVAQKANKAKADRITSGLYEITFNKADFDAYDNKNRGFVLFFKSRNTGEFQDCIRLAVDDTSKYKTMDLDYYASLMEELIKKDGKIIQKGKVATNDRAQFYFFIYEKILGKIKIRVYNRFYLKDGSAYNLSLRAASEKYARRFSAAEPVLDSFKLTN